MLNQSARRVSARYAYWLVVVVASVMLFMIEPVMAAETVTVWDRFGSIMQDFYGKHRHKHDSSRNDGGGCFNRQNGFEKSAYRSNKSEWNFEGLKKLYDILLAI